MTAMVGLWIFSSEWRDGCLYRAYKEVNRLYMWHFVHVGVDIFHKIKRI